MKFKYIIHPGRVLIKLRKLKGFTQRQVSQMSGLHEQTIKQLELELYWPRRKTLEKLSLLFKVELEIFFREDEYARVYQGKYALP